MSTPLPDVMRRAINHLTLEHEFFASLLMEMRLVEVTTPPARILGGKPDDSVPFTMGTDGTRIFWHRSFIDSLNNNYAVCAFALVHEVCHPMLLHLSRVYEHGISGPNWTPKADSKGRLISRDPTLYNVAGDYIINAMLKDSGFKLWNKCLYNPKYTIADGWTTEKVYDDLLKNATKLPPRPGSGRPGEGPGDLIEPSPDTDIEAEAEEWKDRIVRAATLARQRGTLPGALDSLIKEYTDPIYPFYLLLERYVDSCLKQDDYSWREPHRHFMNVGILLPGPYSEQVSRVELWYDTSGSVPDSALSQFHRVGGDIIRNAMPAVLALGQCDAAVTSHTEIRQSSDWPSEIKITGRGGTSFQPPFTYLAERGIRPSLLIYLTDLEGDFPPEPPPYPVLWVSTNPSLTAPFGTTLYLDKE